MRGLFLCPKSAENLQGWVVLSDRFVIMFNMNTPILSEDQEVDQPSVMTVTIQLPVDVAAKLKARAKRNQRSFSGELRFILITDAAEEKEDG